MNYEEALELATRMHSGQKRIKTNEDYIMHPIAVANKFSAEEHKIIAVLHDTIEDTTLTLKILKNLGFSFRVGSLYLFLILLMLRFYLL